MLCNCSSSVVQQKVNWCLLLRAFSPLWEVFRHCESRRLVGTVSHWLPCVSATVLWKVSQQQNADTGGFLRTQVPESLKGDRSEVSSVNSFRSYVYRLHGTVSDCNCREKCHNLQTYDTGELAVSSCTGEVCFGEKGGTEDWLHVQCPPRLWVQEVPGTAVRVRGALFSE